MKINLKQLFSIVGEVRGFSYELAADELGFVKGLEFGAPVKIEGRLYNRAGVVYLNYTVNALVLHTCDRCLKEFERDYRFSFEHIVVPSVNSDNDEYITADGESIEMNDIAVTDLLLQLPAKNLCREECKGLCMVCGCDLNESECNCQKTDAFGLSRNGL